MPVTASGFQESLQSISGMKSPNKPGPWFAKGIGPNRDLLWKLFIVDTNQNTGKLVVRLADALHTEGTPWFTPSPRRWTRWTFIHDPEWRVPPCVREKPNKPRA